MDKRDNWDLFTEITDKLERLLRIAVMIMLILLMTVGICRLARADTYTCVVHRGDWVWNRATPEPNGRQIQLMVSWRSIRNLAGCWRARLRDEPMLKPHILTVERLKP